MKPQRNIPPKACFGYDSVAESMLFHEMISLQGSSCSAARTFLLLPQQHAALSEIIDGN